MKALNTIREALKASAGNGASRTQRLAKDAVPALMALERALPTLMESHHYMEHNPHSTGSALTWDKCSRCMLMLGGE